MVHCSNTYLSKKVVHSHEIKPDCKAEEESQREQFTIQANMAKIAKDEKRKEKAREKKCRQRAQKKVEKVCLTALSY